MSPKVPQRPGAGPGRRGVRTYPDSGRGRGLAVLIAAPHPHPVCVSTPAPSTPSRSQPGCGLGLWPVHFAPRRSAPSLPPSLLSQDIFKKKKRKKKLGGLGRRPKILLGPTRCLFLYIYMFCSACFSFFGAWPFFPPTTTHGPGPALPVGGEQLGVGGGWVLGSVSSLSPVGSVVAPAGCIAF